MSAADGCKGCPMLDGCFLVTGLRPRDVLEAPCGKALGYCDRLSFWVADMTEWKAVQGTKTPPKGIGWVVKIQEEGSVETL